MLSARLADLGCIGSEAPARRSPAGKSGAAKFSQARRRLGATPPKTTPRRPDMKTVPTQVHPLERDPGSNLARRIGTQLAAVLLAMVVVPSALQAVDKHAEPTPPLKRSAVPGPRV